MKSNAIVTLADSNYFELTNLTYFPIFPHYVDFSKVAADSPLAAAAAAAAAQLAAEPQPQIVLRFCHSKFWKCYKSFFLYYVIVNLYL